MPRSNQITKATRLTKNAALHGRGNRQVEWVRTLVNQKNRQVIEEFRANNGVVTVTPPRGPVLLLHTKGARSGKDVLTPLMYMKDGDRFVIFASKGGWKTNPDWYYNLLAHPGARIEVGTELLDVVAREVHGEERATLFHRQAADYPQFAYYQGKTKRVIPVIILDRAGQATS